MAPAAAAETGVVAGPDDWANQGQIDEAATLRSSFEGKGLNLVFEPDVSDLRRPRKQVPFERSVFGLEPG